MVAVHLMALQLDEMMRVVVGLHVYAEFDIVQKGFGEP